MAEKEDVLPRTDGGFSAGIAGDGKKCTGCRSRSIGTRLFAKRTTIYQQASSFQTQAKVLVICGREDSDNGSAEALSKLIPKAMYRTVPGDHGGAVRTKEFSEEVISFFETLTSNQ